MSDLARRTVPGGLLAVTSAAADWPERRVISLLRFPAGGATDVFARPTGSQVE